MIFLWQEKTNGNQRIMPLNFNFYRLAIVHLDGAIMNKFFINDNK